ncbi:MAG: transketolase [Clostridia bacterium]|nr:transketolase [Clostridia bacterium]
MEKKTLLMLKEKAARIRMLSVEAVYGAKSGHPGGSLSIAELVTYLYFNKMNVVANNPDDENRDRFVLSKGHCAPALYSALALKGFFDVEELKKLRKLGAMLQGHPDMKLIPGVDMSTGSLGQGFSAACGMAAVGKRKSLPWKVFTILGDGEIEEGQVWEAAMFANQYKLDNIIAFVDLNGYQIDGAIEDVMNPHPVDDKFRAFGWYAQVIDGHDFEAIEEAVANAEKSDKPSVIICKTVKGKGVSYMENNYNWHGKAPKEDEYLIAEKELREAWEKASEELNNG